MKKKSFFNKQFSTLSEEASGVKLIVKVIKAEGILAKDRGGTSDPFAQVKLGKQVSCSDWLHALYVMPGRY